LNEPGLSRGGDLSARERPFLGWIGTLQANEIFSLYCDDYRAAMASLAFSDLKRRQGDLLCSLAFGAAGIAYAAWYGGVVGGEAALFAEAGRWLRAAYRAQRGRLAFLGANARPGAQMPPGSLIYGAAGLPFLGALLAHSRGDRRARALAVERFLSLAGSAETGSAELYKGSAGSLAGTAILWHQTGDPRLRQVGDGLTRLLLAVLAGEEVRELYGGGLAHGTAGVYHALLLWSEASGFPLPAGFSESLAAFLAEAGETPERFCPRPQRYSFLCGGFTGLVVLAAKAAAVLGQPGYLAAARGAAQVMLAHPPNTPDLCCGRAGVASACLALARVDPEGPWEERAREYALSALLCPREDWPRSGLYNGEPALFCLATSFLHRLRAGPPCLDLIRLPPAAPEGEGRRSGESGPRRAPRERRRPGVPGRPRPRR
jgi:eukaryotic-like serine/threonine-protein kinase